MTYSYYLTKDSEWRVKGTVVFQTADAWVKKFTAQSVRSLARFPAAFIFIFYNQESLKLTNCFYPALMTEDTDKEQTSQEEDVASFYMYSEMNEPHQMDSWLIIHRHRWVIRMTNTVPFLTNYCQIALHEGTEIRIQQEGWSTQVAVVVGSLGKSIFSVLLKK